MDAANDKDVSPLALPGDLPACHALIAQLIEQLRLAQRNNNQLTHQLQQLLRRLYGRSSEKIDPAQMTLFAGMLEQIQAEVAAAMPTPAPETCPPAPAKPVKTPHGRRQFPPDLPRRRIVHDVPESERGCPCCPNTRTKIGEVVTEKLEFHPATLEVLEIVQIKYGCNPCDAAGLSPQIVLAEKPPEAIEKGMAGPGLLAHIIVCKYADHLPLNRQERILGRHDIELSRSTMCDWMAGCAAALRPLYDLMVAEVLLSRVIHTDDTPVAVLDKNRTTTRTGHFWPYVGDAFHPCTVFDYTAGRGGEGPRQFLGDWGKDQKVFLQADAFTGYDGIYVVTPEAINVLVDTSLPALAVPSIVTSTVVPSTAVPATVVPEIAADEIAADAAAAAANAGASPVMPAPATASAAPGPSRLDRVFLMTNAMLAVVASLAAGVIEVACWAHARRKFYEARNSDPIRSAQALAWIRLLYAVEDMADEQKLDAAGRAALRRQFALPRLCQFKIWLESQQLANGGDVLPKSPMGEAITYALNQWDALCVYVLDGDLKIDNNIAENTERRIALGRKNWLFCGSDAGGDTAAVLFSFIATCDRHKVNPFEYLRDVLDRIAATPLSQLPDLLPHRWKPRTEKARPAPD